MINPALFDGVDVNVDVETTGELTRGETVCDYYHLTGKPVNTKLLLKVDRTGFISLVKESLASFG
ncbi:hypothetical protein HMPREF0511_0400 [Limosilactobacillus fermentum ATCC 14931]|nr:hypothetical protein HMPREF0511_0400 [Limosilactobacillus fermentum ATCC 14931]